VTCNIIYDEYITIKYFFIASVIILTAVPVVFLDERAKCVCTIFRLLNAIHSVKNVRSNTIIKLQRDLFLFHQPQIALLLYYYYHRHHARRSLPFNDNNALWHKVILQFFCISLISLVCFVIWKICEFGEWDDICIGFER